MDKYRKQQRKREIEKNKERRKEARAVAAQTKDLSELQAERERLEKAKNAPQIPGQRREWIRLMKSSRGCRSKSTRSEQAMREIERLG